MGRKQSCKTVRFRKTPWPAPSYNLFFTANSTLKNTLKELYLDNIKGIAGTSYDFSEYKNIEKLTITNSKLVTMPTLYRRITDLKLANNYLQDISNIDTGVNLENIDLRNNLIKTFEPLRGFKTIKSLYVSGNNSNALAVVGGKMLGGIIGDKIGLTKISIISLVSAAVLFLFSFQHLCFLVLLSGRFFSTFNVIIAFTFLLVYSLWLFIYL